MSEHPGWMPPPVPPPVPPTWQGPPYGAAPGEAPGWYGGGPGYPRPADTNGFAIASLVCSLVGVLLLVVGPALGIVFGAIGLRQIPRLGQRGRGLAVAGIVIGAIVLLLDVVGIVAAIADGSSANGPGVSV
ncbi:MAG TPA: DUF4190 domain-containing protein [Mycobacteriales bacterium]|nr:DUF4190 domain-containing protein [Mycobacteriales bacterium]